MTNLEKLLETLCTNFQNKEFTSQEVLDDILCNHPSWADKKVSNGKTLDSAKQQTGMEVFGYLSQLLNLSGNYSKTESKLIDKGFTLDKTENLFTLSAISDTAVEDVDNLAEEYNRDSLLSDMKSKLSEEDKFKISIFYDVAKEINAVMGWTGKSHQLKLEVDHAASLKEGGKHICTNLQLLTQRHNTSKGSVSSKRLTLEEQKSYIRKVIAVEDFFEDYQLRLLKVNVAIAKLSEVYG